MSKHIGATYLHVNKSIFIKTEVSRGMIPCWTSVPRPKLNFSYREKLCRGMSLVHFTELRHGRIKTATSPFFTRKWVFKSKKTKDSNEFWLLEACKLVGVLGFGILRRLKQKLELWKKFGASTIWFSSSSSSFPFSCHLWLYSHCVFVLL